jgi:hypothetical protein
MITIYTCVCKPLTLHQVPSPSPAELQLSSLSTFVLFLSVRLRQSCSGLNIVTQRSQTWNCKRSMDRKFSYTYQTFVVLTVIYVRDFNEPPLIEFQEGFRDNPSEWNFINRCCTNFGRLFNESWFYRLKPRRALATVIHMLRKQL